MYVASDPRSALTQTAGDKKPPAAPVAPAGYFVFDESHPFDEADGVKTWYAQAENFVIAYSDARAGSRLVRAEQADEYMVILPERDTRITISWNGTETEVEGYSIVFVPGGPSTMTVTAAGPVVRFLTRKAADIVARCEALLPPYVPDKNVPPLQPWPDPRGGFEVRAYSLDVPQEQGRFGRIFRSTNFMVNFVYPRQGPRDRTQLSPHKHDDFQQCSLCVAGTFIHHIRWPWETDANTWREDDHVTCGAPSVAIIPAVALHTSEAVGKGVNQLVDVFCPPRKDFSVQPGWVLNAADYPAPDGQGE
ncbi:hypothetical protein [Chelativorans sp. AA-79]|uniref:hypothetical protein n=1 Tax=Chelativorans sp. AA-79 TaxID=3028735 RepID=UPI0023F6D225|nr:hypothetical protein [Chelativorans sp. AA-79]WEX08092.1 hypothetical protein PVE73_18655 [Chelativorans sp. AA-79]